MNETMNATEAWARRTERLRSTLRRGGASGIFLRLPALESARVAGERYDFLIVDLEHSQIPEHFAWRMLEDCHLRDHPVLVRVRDAHPERLNRLLEAGANGIQVSSVETVDAVAAVVRGCAYAPAGHRSASTGHLPAGYGDVDLASWTHSSADAVPLVVPQVETAAGVAACEAIAAADVDAIFVGSSDLSIDLGVPGDLAAASMVAAVESVAKTAKTGDTPWGGWFPGPIGRDLVPDFVVTTTDLAALRTGMARVGEGT